MKVAWNREAFRRLRTSDFALGEVRGRADRIAEACGEGYVARSSVPRNRARAAVITATGKAMRDNAENNTLLRNLGAGR